MDEKLATVARFADPIQADLARHLREGRGIRAVVMGQDVGNVWSGVPAGVDIELQTLESQAAEAQRILESREQQE